MILRRNSECAGIEPLLRTWIGERRIALQVRTVQAEDAADIPRIAVIEAQQRRKWLSCLRRGDAAHLEVAVPPTPPRNLVHVRGAQTLPHVEAGERALQPVVPAVLREILVRNRAQVRGGI